MTTASLTHRFRLSVRKGMLALYRASPFYPHLSRPIARLLSAVRGERTIVKDLPRFRMSLNTAHWIDSRILLTDTFEPTTTDIIAQALAPGMTAVDVGANIGWLTLTMAAAVEPGGRVHAFEPSDWTYERLMSNIGLNRFKGISGVRAAVGETDGQIELMLPCGYRLDGRDTATRQSVGLVRLDTALDGVHVDLLKIDTDGSELEVILGAKKLIERSNPLIVFEVISRTPAEKLQAIFDFLGENRYRVYSEALEIVENPSAYVRAVPTGTANLVAATPDRFETLRAALSGKAQAATP